MFFLGEPHLAVHVPDLFAPTHLPTDSSEGKLPLPCESWDPEGGGCLGRWAGCGATSGGAAPRGTPSSAVSWEEGELATLFLGSSGLFK